ncbi:DUF1622 domain-containing protein [Gillisia limnaea]|uniref:DUF1622 domain-containing protein n=2 Tax=Gillisia TaxID=244698 RepID=H2BQL5_GILLR|nr:protein of unknown function DUF1622 [Gillisia limnaea DSM 15749]
MDKNNLEIFKKMKEAISFYLDLIATSLEILGVLIIVTGILLSFGKYLFKMQASKERSFSIIRKDLGRSIILGLEVLIGADIIGTIIYNMTMEKILSLAMIIVIRTFLSFALEIEIDGEFPWKRGKKKD